MAEISRHEAEPSEMSEVGKRIIKLFQEAKKAEGKDRERLLQEFYDVLIRAVTPGDKRYHDVSNEHLENVIMGGPGPNHCLWVGSGTAGSRIYFNEEIYVPEGKDPAKYGPDLELVDGDQLKSTDKKPRWMWYPKPAKGGDWAHGHQFWERFMENFGDTTIDLQQKLE
ncbi:MAG: hypothetical protein NTY04_02905 [Candidatus Staskawiczbacteria bacterium]|nr:hypothetical protein [Candidatus Staskawiczbacteria bacterium]